MEFRIVYIILLISVIAAYVNNNKRYFGFLVLFLLYYLASSRIGEGADYYSYLEMFNYVDDQPINEWSNKSIKFSNVELVFRLLISTAKNIGLTYQEFISLTAIVTLVYIGKLVYKYSEHPNLSILIYFGAFFFFWPYSGIRGGLIYSIGTFFLCEYIENKNRIKFILIVLLLSLLHQMAISYLLLMLIVSIKDKKTYLIFLASSCIVSFFMAEIVIDLIDHSLFSSRVKFYYNNSVDFYSFKFIARLIIFCITLFAYVIYIDKLNEVNNKLFQIFLISFPIFIIFNRVIILAEQISLIAFSLIILVPVSTISINNSLIVRKIIKSFLIIFSIIYFNITYKYNLESSYKNNKIVVEKKVRASI